MIKSKLGNAYGVFQHLKRVMLVYKYNVKPSLLLPNPEQKICNTLLLEL